MSSKILSAIPTEITPELLCIFQGAFLENYLSIPAEDSPVRYCVKEIPLKSPFFRNFCPPGITSGILSGVVRKLFQNFVQFLEKPLNKISGQIYLTIPAGISEQIPGDILDGTAGAIT